MRTLRGIILIVVLGLVAGCGEDADSAPGDPTPAASSSQPRVEDEPAEEASTAVSNEASTDTPPPPPPPEPGAIDGPPAPGSEPLVRIVVTARPLELWLNELILPQFRNDLRVVRLVPDGVDPFTYAPSEEQIDQIASADLLVCDGGSVDGWVLAHVPPQGVEVLNMRLLLSDTRGRFGLFEREDLLWLDPAVVGFLTGVVSRRLAWHIRDQPLEIENPLRAGIKEAHASFTEGVESLDARFARELAPLRSQPVVTTRGRVRALLRRYGVRPVIAVERPDGSGLDEKGTAEATAAFTARTVRAIVVDAPGALDSTRELAETSGVTLVEVDTTGEEVKVWSLLMSRLVDDLLDGLVGDER